MRDFVSPEQWLRDLEDLFQRAMADGNWVVALRVKEIVGRFAGFLQNHAHRPKKENASEWGIKPLTMWTDRELEALLQALTISEKQPVDTADQSVVVQSVEAGESTSDAE